MNDKWQDKLRSRMESHEESAPEGLWESLEQQIVSEKTLFDYKTFENKVSKITNSKTTKPVIKKHRLWGIGIVAAAAAVILLFFVLNIPNNNQINEFLINDNQTTSELIDNSVSEIDETVKLPLEVTTQTTVSGIKIAKNNTIISDSKTSISKNKESVSKEIITKKSSIESSDEEYKEVVPKDSNQKENMIKEDLTDKQNIYRKNDQLLASSTGLNNQKKSRWQTNISMSNTSSGFSETYSGYGTFALEETVDRQYAFTSQYTRERAYTDVKHDQPITFGLTLRYNLNDRWSLTSGLTYSFLSSRLRSESSNYFYDDTQKLHYLGIPLNVAYTFWQNNKVLTYISAGGLVEKNIAGKLTSNYYIDNELEMATSNSVTSRQLQWSVNSAIGIEYRVSDLIGVYAEPGVVYYFNNSSELETIYKDRPANFNLRLGLRLNFNK